MRHRNITACGILTVFSLFACAAGAQTAYVTDKLRLGVHAAPDTSDRPFANLESGDQVTIHEQNQYYARITMPDGRDGWVKRTFLTEEPPAAFRIVSVEQERDRATAEAAGLQRRLVEREEELGRLREQVATGTARNEEEQAELAELRESTGELRARLESYGFSVPLTWFLLAAVLCFVAGVLGARWWLDRRSRQRHGGFVVR